MSHIIATGFRHLQNPGGVVHLHVVHGDVGPVSPRTRAPPGVFLPGTEHRGVGHLLRVHKVGPFTGVMD
jgi:hypothetical protein